MIYDASRPDPVFIILKYIRCRKEGFYGMHIGIYSAIGGKLGKFCIPCICGKSLLLIPEESVISICRFLKELSCTLPSGGQR